MPLVLESVHDDLRVHHINSVLSISQAGKIMADAAHARHHILVLHPFGVDWPPSRLSLLATLENCRMLVVASAAGA